MSRSDPRPAESLISDRYRVRGIAGRGAASVVYRVHDRLLGRDLALKRYHRKADRGLERTLSDEFVLLARLDHPALPKVHDFSVDARGLPFFTMDFLAGPSLSALMPRWNRISRTAGWLLLGRYAGRILSALTYIHARGIVHGDIKPSNILFTSPSKGMPEARNLRLVDFGLSGALAELEGQAARGTPHYMAPEVLRGGAPDAQSDLFSLGRVLSECLGERAETVPGLAGFEGSLVSFIARLREPARGLRFRSAEEAYGDLLALLEKADGKAAAELSKSFSFAVRPRSWDSGVASMSKRLSDCRSGRGGALVAEGVRGACAERILGELRARALASGMSVVRCPVPGEGPPERLRVALAQALARWSPEGSMRRRDAKHPRDEPLKAPSSALATRLADASRRAGAPGALWILENEGPLRDGDCRGLSHLSLALRRHPALVVIACTGFAGEDPRACRDAGDIISFPPLDEDAVEQVLIDIFREIQPLAGFARILMEASGGDAEELSETLNHLVESEAVRRRQGSWYGDPVAVRRLLRKGRPAQRDLGGLPPALEIQTRSLAALGMLFDERTAAVVTGMPPPVLRRALAELRSAGYVRETQCSDVERHWRFVNPALPERLAGRLRPSTRRSLHRRALRHLESLMDPRASLAERAWHLEGAGENALAVRALLEMAKERRDDRDLLGACAHLDHALALVPKDAPPLEHETRYRLALALQELGHTEQSLSHFERLLRTGRDLPSGIDLADLQVAQARNLEVLGRHDEAMELLDAAYSGTRAEDLGRLSIIQRTRGWIACLGGLVREADGFQTEALAAATASGDAAEIASAHALRGNILRASGKETEAEVEFRKAIDLRPPTDAPREALRDLSNLGILLLRSDPAKAAGIFRDLVDRCRKVGDDHAYASNLVNLAIVEKNLGDWSAAEKSYRVSIDVGEQIGMRGLHRAYMNLGNLLTDRGEFEEASACLDRASILAARHSGRTPVLFVELNRARLALRRGRPEETVRLLESAEPGLSPNHPATWINLHLYRAQALAELGRFEEAGAAALVASTAAADQHDETFRGEALLYGGIVERLSGNREGARAKIDGALALFERHGQIHYAARARLQRAEIMALDEATAREGLAEAEAAAATFERLGMAPFLARAQRLRERLADTARRRADAPRELTTLYRVAEILRAASDLPSLLEGVLDAAINLLGAERGTIFLRNPEREGDLDQVASRYLSAEEAKDVRKTSQGILRTALRDDTPLLSRDAMQDARLRSRKSVIKYEIRSVVCAALRAGDKVIGTIYLDHKEPGRFSESEAEFLRALAGFAAPAIVAAGARQRLDEEVRGLRQEVKHLAESGLHAYQLSSLLGPSEAMREVRELVEKCSQTRSNVLILGETGTGKDLVARVIHETGPRSARPFLPVGGSELQGDLANSTLFGIAAGTATGVEGRAGKFELANGGTLYLHEVEALPLDTQARLLRVIEERKVERVGGTTRLPLNVRLIAATSADLQDLIAQGTFRRDLYFRLDVLSIEIPPLRRRREDVAPLLHHFLSLAAAEMGRPPLRITPAVMREYEAYEWPGNIRELKHLVERAVVTGGEEFPHLAALARTELRGGDARWLEEIAVRDERLASFCAKYVERVFDRCGRRHNLACEVLGINYRTLKRHLAVRGRRTTKRDD